MVLPLTPPSAPSALGDLLTEIQTIILSYLVGTNASSGSKYHPGHEYADLLQFTNNHQFHPSILRTSKSLYDIGKAVLQERGKWAVFDMDHAELLLSWGWMDVPFTMVDPEDADLPEGIMRVRVKVTRGVEFPLAFTMPWPQSRSHRQLVLVAAHDVPAFVRKLRIVQLAHGIRCMPDEHFMSDTRESCTARKGFHDMSVLVHVSPTYPKRQARELLSAFRALHGPLNEVSKVEFSDTAFTNAIEASISAPRDPISDNTFHELLLLVLDLSRQAASFALARNWPAACALYKICIELVDNHANDSTPWAGWATNTFEELVLLLPDYNAAFAELANGGPYKLPRGVTWGKPLHVGNVDDRALNFALLVYGAYVAAKGGYLAKSQRVRDGLNYIARARKSALECTKPSGANVHALFDAGGKMWDVLRENMGADDVSVNEGRKIEACVEEFKEVLKPVRWRVQEALIPDVLKQRGVLEFMKRCDAQGKEEVEEDKESLTVDAVGYVDGAGEYYLL